LWLAADGTLWASDGDGEPWKRPRGGSWSSAPLPASIQAYTLQLWQRAEGDVWVTAQRQSQYFVLHTHQKG
jgi:hypothetical protein